MLASSFYCLEKIVITTLLFIRSISTNESNLDLLSNGYILCVMYEQIYQMGAVHMATRNSEH